MDNDFNILDFLLGLLVASVLIWFLFDLYQPYKQGQIDALNGIIKYELVERPDHTKEWKEIKQRKD